MSQDVFQYRMDQILENRPGTVNIADDVIVYVATEEEHDTHLLNLMAVAGEHGLTFNSDKCLIKTDTIPFFGEEYSAQGVRPDPEKVADIQSIPAPSNKDELHRFIGIATYMGSYLPQLSQQLAPLRDSIPPGTLWWRQEANCQMHNAGILQPQPGVRHTGGRFISWTRGCAATGRPSHCLRQQSLDSYGTTLRKHWAWNAGCRVRLRTLPHVRVWQEFHGHLWPQATRDDLLEKPNDSSTSSTAHVAQGPRIRFCYQVQAR